MIYTKLKNYFVGDLVYDDTEVLFVLESPHKEEVKMGYPVAGKSGRDMSKVLCASSEPFGKLISEKKLAKIGIINISNYPLQKSAYKEEYALLELFEKFRQNPQLRKYDKIGLNDVVSKMMDSFGSRLESHKDKKIVLCGRFAQNAFDVLFDALDFKEVLRVPHPSFNQWLRASNKEIIKKLEEFIQ